MGEDKCKRCHREPASDLHSCPYQREINDNNDAEYCDCCADCEQECRDSI